MKYRLRVFIDEKVVIEAFSNVLEFLHTMQEHLYVEARTEIAIRSPGNSEEWITE